MLTILFNFHNFILQWFGSDNVDLTPEQMMLRAVVTFIFALLIIRIAGIRSFGSKSAFDVVLSITVGAVLSRCITGKHPYFACLAGATVLALMHRCFAMMIFHSKSLAHLIKGKACILIDNNKINWRNMQRHNVTMEDVMEALRKRGFASLEEISEVLFETDGKISLIPKAKRILPT
jgi:uncharacterized membrane protein YcaP (DUF421 family)